MVAIAGTFVSDFNKTSQCEVSFAQHITWNFTDIHSLTVSRDTWSFIITVELAKEQAPYTAVKKYQNNTAPF